MHVVVAGDIDGDGVDELMGTENGGLTLRVCRWNGLAWVTNAVPIPGQVGLDEFAAGDFDGDGNLDLAFPGFALFGDGMGGWIQGPYFALLPSTTYLAVGDIDRDGLDDIAMTSTSGVATVYRSNGNRTFSSWSTGLPSVPNASLFFWDTAPHLADVTGDGFPDLVAEEGFPGGEALVVFAGNGSGTWSPAGFLQPGVDPYGQFAISSAPGSSGPCIIVADNNSSGMEGIRVYSYLGGSQWSSTMTVLASGHASSVLVHDFDGDGLEDILLREDGPNATLIAPRLRLFRTLPGPTFIEDGRPGLTEFSGSTRYVVGDFNGDGWPDLAGAQLTTGAFAWLNMSLGAHLFAAGCNAGTVAPGIAPVGVPQIGNLGFGVELSGVGPVSLGIAWLGLDNRSIYGGMQLPVSLAQLGAPGCRLLVEPVACRVLLLGAQGRAILPAPLALNPAFHRMLLYSQGAILTPGANALGLLFSQGLAIRVN